MPDEGGANRSYYVAKALVAAGHEVTMLTTHDESQIKTKVIEKVKVVYLPVPYDNTLGFWGRIKAFLSFVTKAKSWLAQKHNFDKCIATSTPLTVGLIATWLKKNYQVPFVFEVRDLWPEAPIQMGVIKNPILKRFLRRVERNIYKQADQIIALSPGMRNHIEKIVPERVVNLIPNMADCDFFQPNQQKNEDLELHYGVKGKFVISYFGAIGPVNDLMSLVKSAEYCLDLPIRFLIMGSGKSLLLIKKYVQVHEISNVFFIPYGTKEEVRDVMQVTDACYVSFLHKAVLRTNSPNKFFDAIAAGKLIITNIQGWIRGLVEKRNFGIYADSDIPVELREKILPFLESKELLLKYQSNARQTGEQFFSRAELCQQFISIVEGKKQSFKIQEQIFSLSA
jgi:glycosyltransferase involved in cell wall biosynthesis